MGFLDRIRNNWVLIGAVLAAVANLLVGLGVLAEGDAEQWVTLLESVGLLLLGLIQRANANGPLTSKPLPPAKKSLGVE